MDFMVINNFFSHLTVVVSFIFLIATSLILVPSIIGAIGIFIKGDNITADNNDNDF